MRVPLIGTVTAGSPILAAENYDGYYTLPTAEFSGDGLFLLSVQGDSMVEAGIYNGDKIGQGRDKTRELLKNNPDLAAEMEEKIAASDRLPSVTLSAGVSTGHNSQDNHSFGSQLSNRLSENIGLNVSIPIAQRRQVKSAVEKARVATETAQLEELNTRKTLLKTIAL